MGYLLVLRIAGVNFTPAYVEQIQRLPDILSIHRLGQQRIWICHDLSRNIAPQNPKLHHVSSKIAREMSGFWSSLQTNIQQPYQNPTFFQSPPAVRLVRLVRRTWTCLTSPESCKNQAQLPKNGA